MMLRGAFPAQAFHDSVPPELSLKQLLPGASRAELSKAEPGVPSQAQREPLQEKLGQDGFNPS